MVVGAYIVMRRLDGGTLLELVSETVFQSLAPKSVVEVCGSSSLLHNSGDEQSKIVRICLNVFTYAQFSTQLSRPALPSKTPTSALRLHSPIKIGVRM